MYTNNTYVYILQISKFIVIVKFHFTSAIYVFIDSLFSKEFFGVASSCHIRKGDHDKK